MYLSSAGDSAMAYFLLPSGANVGAIPIKMQQAGFLRQVISTSCARTFEVLDDNVEWWLSQCDLSPKWITAEFAPDFEAAGDDVRCPPEVSDAQPYNADYSRMYAVLESAVNGCVARVSDELLPENFGFLSEGSNQHCFRHDVNINLSIRTFGETADFQCYTAWLAGLNSRSAQSRYNPNHLSAVKVLIEAQVLQETRGIGGTLGIAEGSWLPIGPSEISSGIGDFVLHIKSRAGLNWTAEVFTNDLAWRPLQGTFLTRTATVLVNDKLNRADCIVGAIL